MLETNPDTGELGTFPVMNIRSQMVNKKYYFIFGYYKTNWLIIINDICFSDETEGDNDECEVSPDSPRNIKENIKSKFLVDMPQDFYDFWDFVKTVNSKRPEGLEQ